MPKGSLEQDSVRAGPVGSSKAESFDSSEEIESVTCLHCAEIFCSIPSTISDLSSVECSYSSATVTKTESPSGDGIVPKER